MACLSPVTTEAASVLLLPDRIRKSCSDISQKVRSTQRLSACTTMAQLSMKQAGSLYMLPAFQHQKCQHIQYFAKSITATNILHTLSSVSVSSAFPGVCIIRLKRPNASCNRLTFLTCSSHTHSTSRQAHQSITSCMHTGCNSGNLHKVCRIKRMR